jgi:hypothetical protein
MSTEMTPETVAQEMFTVLHGRRGGGRTWTSTPR